jgi:hypothetical protein
MEKQALIAIVLYVFSLMVIFIIGWYACEVYRKKKQNEYDYNVLAVDLADDIDMYFPSAKNYLMIYGKICQLCKMKHKDEIRTKEIISKFDAKFGDLKKN